MPPILARAIATQSSPTAFARAIGVKLPSLYSWTRIPVDKLVAVERATGIPRHELRPDLIELFHEGPINPRTAA